MDIWQTASKILFQLIIIILFIGAAATSLSTPAKAWFYFFSAAINVCVLLM